MPYTTQADLEKRFGTDLLVRLTDRGATPTGQINTDTVAEAIADAAARIDAAIRTRYTLPLTGTPDPLGKIAAHIALYNLHVYEPNEKVVRDYTTALADLKMIGAGQLQLDAAGVEPATTGGQGARITDRDRDFTAKTMGGFI